MGVIIMENQNNIDKHLSSRSYRCYESPFPEVEDVAKVKPVSVKFVEDQRRLNNPMYDPRVEAANKVAGDQTSGK